MISPPKSFNVGTAHGLDTFSSATHAKERGMVLERSWHFKERGKSLLRTCAYQIVSESSNICAKSSAAVGRGESLMSRCWASVPSTNAGMSAVP